MKLELVAFSPIDGNAIIKRDDAFFFVSPPYESRNLQHITPDVLERAINKFDFHAVSQTFPSWDALLEFLNLKVKETRLGRGENIEEMDLAQEIIDAAPEEILMRFLEKVEKELRLSRNYNLAEFAEICKISNL